MTVLRGTTRPALPASPGAPADPNAEKPDSSPFLHGLNPLAKLLGSLPLIVLVTLSRDPETLLLVFIASWIAILLGARGRRRSLLILALMPAVCALMTVGFGFWVPPNAEQAGRVFLQLGPLSLNESGLALGLTTALRLLALGSLLLVGGLSTTGPELIQAAIQHLRLPYRVGYAALASYRFIPRFQVELDTIRSARRIRGLVRSGTPWARASQFFGALVPLLASGLRYAERVALSMEARAFGAFPTRTERSVSRIRVRDGAFVIGCWVLATLLVIMQGVR